MNNKDNLYTKLKKNKLAFAGLIFLTVITLMALLGYAISPDNTPYANRQILELSAKRPGFKISMLKTRKNVRTESGGFFKQMLSGKRDRYNYIPIDSFYLSRNKVYYSIYEENKEVYEFDEMEIVDVLFDLDIDGHILQEGDSIHFKTLENGYQKADIEELKARFLKENLMEKRFLLGTDRFGRDLLSRMMIGSRISLSVGFMAVLISLLIGIVLGLVSGYFHGWVDKSIMFLINVVWAVPALLMALALSMVMGKGFWQLFLAIGLTMWVEVARVVRGQVLSVKEKDYITAAKVLGFSNFRILFRHILPNIINPVIIICAANFSTAILLEAGLSFLGIGIQPPVPSWGGIIRDHYGFIIVDQAYLAMVPGVAIILLVLSFTFVGNGLRDALDVRR